MRKSELTFNVVRLPVDFAMLIFAGLTTYVLRTEILSRFRPVLFEFNLPLIKYLYLVFFVALLFIGCYAVSGLYSMKGRLRIFDEFLRIIIASSAGIMVIIIYIFLRQELFNSRFLVLGGWLLAVIFVFLGRFIVRHVQEIMVSRFDYGVSKILIIGNNNSTLKVTESVNSDPGHGYRLASVVPSMELIDIKLAIDRDNIDEIILTDTITSSDKLNQLINYCHEKHIAFRFVPDIYTQSLSTLHLDFFNGVPLIEIKRTSLEGWGRVIKRCIDVVGSLFGLLILSPVFGIVALAIKWETEGPVFVRLERVSGNRKFELLKFRSMINNAHFLNQYLRSVANDRKDSGPLWKLKNDPRITRVGRIIRKYRLDELPQLFNALRGDISLVGPRPHQPNEVEKYQSHHKKVLAIKGGITGLAQVSGSSDISFEEEVVLDSFYIDNWSLLLDSKIIIKTIARILVDRSAV